MEAGSGALTLGEVFYPAVVAFQALLAVLLLTTARPTAVRSALGLVLVLGAFEGFMLWLASAGVSIDDNGYLLQADVCITLTLAYLVSQFPAPLGGPRGARVATGLWVGTLAAWVLVVAPLGPSLPGWAIIHPVLQDGSQVLALALMATHTIPRTLELSPGLLRRQAVLVAAGIGLGVLRTNTLFAIEAAEGVAFRVLGQTGPVPPDALPGVVVRFAMYAAAFYFLWVLLVRSAWSASRRPSRDGVALLGAFALGTFVGVADQVLPFTGGVLRPTSEFLSQALRPLLISLAVLQYDLLKVPRSLRRPVVRVSAGLFALSLFVFVALMLGQQGFASTTMDPAAAVGSVIVLLVLAGFLQRPLQEVFSTADAAGAEERARLERYRLAMERARQGHGGPDTAELAALRIELGITRQQHAALADILEGNLVMPTSALVGVSPGTVLQGRYEVVRELGMGGQGRVLLAHDRIDKQEVVLKEVLRPWEAGADANRLALQREAALLQGIESPHLPRVHGIVTEPWQTYLVREYVPGQDLEAVVAAGGPLPPGRAAEVVADVLAGLEALHRGGVLHLDLKPANVVLRPDGRALLIDQGAARRMGPPSGPDATRLRAGADDAISLPWAAPEQFRGGVLDERTDVFQAAGVLFFALTGRRPVTGELWGEVERRVVSGEPLAWDAVVPPEPLRETVERGRAVAPAKRYASAAAFRAAVLGAVRPGL